MNTKIFRSRIRNSLSNENLQGALDANAERRVKGRLAAFSSIPDYQERRARAHAIKADVVRRLDEHLEKFIGKVQENGIIVHRAKDASEAVQIVLDIAEKQKATSENHVHPRSSESQLLFAKSKSMVSEEINLNHVLAGHDINVVETDLGEYIVQLRGERPAHIITPAVHLRRQDVGRLFAEKLGIPYTEDIPTLTNTARKVLREVFLTADIGVSGVNFGVVESGSLCIVTNEGNGRMCTTLPSVHIALMGIERLVPTMGDLALFLSLLPRSATGQKLSVYTSLINSPLQYQTRHLVLLDNGRYALRASALAESLCCIRCGACLNACPVFRELGGHAYGSVYPGPIGSVISSTLIDPRFACLSQASSLCGACKDICPVDIDLPGMLLKVRAGQSPRWNGKEGVGLPSIVKLGLGFFCRVAAVPWLYTGAQQIMGLFPLPDWIRIPAFTGWGYSKDFPRPAASPFRRRWKRVNREEGTPTEEGKSDAKTAIKREAPGETGKVAPTRIEPIERFTIELRAVSGDVVRVSEKDVRLRLAKFFGERGIDRVLVDDAAAGYVTGAATAREQDPSIRAGVTGALCGIAETGSVVLVSGAGQTLTASLLPEIHIVLLKTSRLVSTVADALCKPEVRQAAAGVLITGPSRTGDIEMSHTIGVHGPGELHVFLIDE